MIDKFTILPVAPTFAEAIARIYNRQAVNRPGFRLISEQFNYVNKQAGFNLPAISLFYCKFFRNKTVQYVRVI